MNQKLELKYSSLSPFNSLAKKKYSSPEKIEEEKDVNDMPSPKVKAFENLAANSNFIMGGRISYRER